MKDFKRLTKHNLFFTGFFLLLCITKMVWAAELNSTETTLKRLLSQLQNFEGKHSVCYMTTDSKELKVKGINLNEKVRLASVSKLLTSYWVLYGLGPKYKFKTYFYWDPTTAELYIQGSQDPFFGRRRLYLLISDLNRLGIRQINKIYFNKNFKYFQAVEHPSTQHTEITQQGGISPRSMAIQLNHLLNIKEWDEGDIMRYGTFSSIAHSIKVPVEEFKKMELKVLEILPIENDINPFLGRTGIQAYVSESPAVLNYLKVMNMFSMNYPADELFNQFGGQVEFKKFLLETLKIKVTDLAIFTGSGLPTLIEGQREDNETTCEVIVDVILKMKEILVSNKLNLEDIMMVGGIDQGTLFRAYKSNPLRGSVIAKTGTIATAHSLAGAIELTKNKQLIFGIFLQTTKLAKASKLRNQLVSELARKNGGAKPIDYNKGYSFVSFLTQSSLHPVKLPDAILP